MKVTDDRIAAWLEGDLSGEEGAAVAAAVVMKRRLSIRCPPLFIPWPNVRLCAG